MKKYFGKLFVASFTLIIVGNVCFGIGNKWNAIFTFPLDEKIVVHLSQEGKLGFGFKNAKEVEYRGGPPSDVDEIEVRYKDGIPIEIGKFTLYYKEGRVSEIGDIKIYYKEGKVSEIGPIRLSYRSGHLSEVERPEDAFDLIVSYAIKP